MITRGRNDGFTLIELSIVLVIIGLIIGGILVGQDMISASAVRATIAQIEKYNSAVNTFKNKYSYIPGDIPDPYASQFGFVARGLYAGEGDGNGVIEGVHPNAPSSSNGLLPGNMGETSMFWVDLSTANMIDGKFNTASPNSAIIGTATPTSSPNISAFLPTPKLGGNNYIYIWSTSGINYYGISVVTGDGWGISSGSGLSVQQAYNIDKKMDDGLPQSGQVTARYIGGPFNSITWAASGTTAGASPGGSATGSTSTCFDNGGGTGTMQYSMEISSGSNVNCALSFQMQGAAR